ncbi:MAG TPA: histidine kinase [Burkholderiales bacterium]|nr:histidine kinase [Burkholderiales bacterium]
MELAEKNRWLRERAQTWLAKLQALAHRALFGPGEAMVEDSEFLPNFCTGWVVFNVVVVAELLAIMVALIMPRGVISSTTGQDLVFVSLFVQWVALGGTAALCYTRRWLNRLPNLRALAAAYALLLLVTFLIGEITLWMLWLTKKIPVAHAVWYADFHLLNLTVSAIVNGLLLRYFLAKHELKQRTLSEARARLEALQSRIRPHFVFNALNIIASLVRTDPGKAEKAIEDMADLFRMMLSHDEQLVPVKNEIDVTKQYLALEKLRLDNRLNVEWDVGTFPRKAVMPILTLQPLLENAIRHGIEEMPSGGTVAVRLWEDTDTIHIRVTNPVPTARRKERITTSHVQSLDNIRQRFHSHYGNAAILTGVEQNGEFIATVMLPIRGDKS